MNGDSEKKRLRFTYEDDVILLREVLGKNPFMNGVMWEAVKNSVFLLTKKLFSIKTIRQHINLLLEQHVEKDRINQKSSGIEEPYSEKDSLILEVKEIANEERESKKKKSQLKKKQIKDSEEGKIMREQVAMNFYESHLAEHDLDTILEEVPDTHQDEILNITNEEDTPVMEVTPDNSKKKAKTVLGPIRNRSRKTTYTGLEYLKEKTDKELALEERRIALEERKLVLEERRVAVSERNTALAEKKLMFDCEHYSKIFEAQQQVIMKLLSTVDDLKK